MKLAFVVQRYGKEIIGGSESLARQIAERLSRRHDITVLTTTAKDYVSWKNEYPVGESKHRGVTIKRFPVVAERDLDAFNEFSKEIYEGEPTKEDEIKWLHRQGPVVPALIDHLKQEQGSYDLILFFTYLYYPTVYGVQVAPSKSLLVPTAHDEPPIRLSIYKDTFCLPDALIFNTEAEELLVLERFAVHKRMRETIGMGLDLLEQPDSSTFRTKHKLDSAYLLYAGRIDAGKGCDEMIRFFRFYKEENPSASKLQLVLIGNLAMKLPEDKSIRYLGFVDEAEKLEAMAGAAAVLMPSRMESFSIVTLEAFSVSTPVVAHGASQVVVDHCRKSNAGLYYRDFEEFEGILDTLFRDKNLGRALGRNGQRYVKENYGWTKLLAKYEKAFLAAARSPVKNRDPVSHEFPLPPDPRNYLSSEELLSEEAMQQALSIQAQAGEGRRRRDGKGERPARSEGRDESERSEERRSRGRSRRGAAKDSRKGVASSEPPSPDETAQFDVSEIEALAHSRSDDGLTETEGTVRFDPPKSRDSSQKTDSEQTLVLAPSALPDSEASVELPDSPNEEAEPATKEQAEARSPRATSPPETDLAEASQTLRDEGSSERDEAPLSPETEHLPSFFRRSIPDKPAPPLVGSPPKPEAAETEITQVFSAASAFAAREPDSTAEPTPQSSDADSPDLEKTTPDAADAGTAAGGLPSFYRATVPKRSVPVAPPVSRHSESVAQEPPEHSEAEPSADEASESEASPQNDEGLPAFFRQRASANRTEEESDTSPNGPESDAGLESQSHDSDETEVFTKSPTDELKSRADQETEDSEADD